ncbi:MAG: hypothetical protein KatS3mg038_2750 [Candidatus Kapaibacterium sp.]|nr:MAG: hypothetical protein KatS3mg038_2750 [Candidatus Kapabacteria bacterium]
MRPAPVSEHYVAHTFARTLKRTPPHSGDVPDLRIRGRARSIQGHYKARVIARLDA